MDEDFNVLTQITEMAIEEWRAAGKPIDHESHFIHGELPLLVEIEGILLEQEDDTDQEAWRVTIYPADCAGGDPNTDEVDRDNPMLQHTFEDADD